MIFQVLRLVLVGYLLTAIVYVLISLYSRSLCRERLEKEWAAKGSVGAMEDYVEAGMAEYDGSLRRRAIALIFLVPIVVVAAMIYITNFM